MLLIEGQKLGAKEFCDRFGIDFKKITGKSAFELNERFKKKDRMNRGTISFPSAMLFRSKFHVRDPKTGSDLEIRYATSRSPKRNKNGEMDIKYEPRYVGFEKATVANFSEDGDLAVFMYAHPQNAHSPFRTPNSPKPTYEYIDGKARAIEKLKGIEQLSDALARAKALKGYDLIVIAKGLKVNGVDRMEEDEIRVQLLDFAHKKPKEFLDVVDIGSARTEGRIIDLVDRGVIVMKTKGNVRWWEWAKGERKEERIGQMITDPIQDARKSLVNFMKSNYGEYNSLITDLSETLVSDQILRDKLQAEKDAKELEESKKVPTETSPTGPAQDPPPYNPDNADEDAELIATASDHTAIVKLVQDKGYKAAPIALKDLREAIKEGSVNTSNLDYYLQNNFNPRD